MATACSFEKQDTIGRSVESGEADLETDSLSIGLSFMLVANIMQRGIGFVRNLVFCWLLIESELGQWALASSFFVLAAPLAVLGMPGSFGKFVEVYRRNGQLGRFLQRTSLLAAVGVFVTTIGLCAFPSWSGVVIFGEPMAAMTIWVLAVTLLAVVIFNYLTELLGGLRQPMAVSKMHATNSLVFSVLGIGWLCIDGGVTGLIGTFAIAQFVACVPGVRTLRRRCQGSFRTKTASAPMPIWSRVLPFATAIWCMNLLGNLFDVVDRYMLLHLVSNVHEIGQSLVGQYHCGRILPTLLASLALMLSGMLLPYLSAEWEQKNLAKIRGTLSLACKGTAIVFTVLAFGAVIAAPWIFKLMGTDRYAAGLEIVPMAMIHCTWTALALLMQNYLWCAEKGRSVGVLMAIGLVINIMLNAWWVPMWQLNGAILATTVSGACVLLLTDRAIAKQGCCLGRDVAICILIPLLLLLNWTLVLIGLAGLCVVCLRTSLIFSHSERSLLFSSVYKRVFST